MEAPPAIAHKDATKEPMRWAAMAEGMNEATAARVALNWLGFAPVEQIQAEYGAAISVAMLTDYIDTGLPAITDLVARLGRAGYVVPRAANFNFNVGRSLAILLSDCIGEDEWVFWRFWWEDYPDIAEGLTSYPLAEGRLIHWGYSPQVY